MNERIKELAEQAGLYDEKSPDEVPEFTASFEKFAELLIRECLSYTKEGDLDFMKFMIKQHFGVSE